MRQASGDNSMTQVFAFQFFQSQLQSQDCKIDSIEKQTRMMGKIMKEIAKQRKKEKKQQKKRMKMQSRESHKKKRGKTEGTTDDVW